MSYEAKRTTGRSYRITDGKLAELKIPFLVVTPRLSAAPGLTSLAGFPASMSKPVPGDMDGLPELPENVELYLLDVDVNEDESGTRWTFSAIYRIPTPAGIASGGAGTEEEKTQYQTRITHGTRIVEAHFPWDFDGKPFLNSANRPYTIPPALKVPAKIVTVEKLLKYKVSISGVSGTCNASSIVIDGETFAAGTAILDATCETSGDKNFPWKLRFTVEELMNINDQGENTGCRISIQNEGYDFLEEGVYKRAEVERLNGEGCPAPVPVLLGDSGERLEGPDAVPTFKTYRTARETAWPSWVSA